MSGGFGGLFNAECGEESAASRLGSRFGYNRQQDLYEHAREPHARAVPASFDMAQLLNEVTAQEPHNQPAQPAERFSVHPAAPRPLMMEAAAFPPPPLNFIPPPFMPFGQQLDFHYANAAPRLNLEQQQQAIQDVWDERLLSLSWHDALTTVDPPSDRAELPWEEVRSELENHDSISADFWTEQLRRGRFRRPIEYEFDYPAPEDEKMRDSQWAFAEGMRALAAGDVPTAVFLFETAVRADASDAEAWYQLGAAQQLNENDKAAIAALEKCLLINQKHPLARIALAASFTNELRRADALVALAEWSDLHLPDGEGEGSSRRQRWEAMGDYGGYTFQHQLFQEAEQRLNRILELSDLSDEVRANVESALGILYNISEEYEKAASHFERAIICRPEDPVLFNRLGASLANGDRNSDAVAAYCRALELSPGLLRTRYNLGIASCNMHAYREAVQHFLSVLNKQSDTRTTFVPVPPPTNETSGGLNNSGASSSVWSSLRMAFLAMDRRDLYDLALDQRLPELNEAFASNQE